MFAIVTLRSERVPRNIAVVMCQAFTFWASKKSRFRLSPLYYLENL